MIRSETKIRVRYGETDQMGYVYYGVYAQYYEVGRVDAMRSLGFSYKQIEESKMVRFKKKSNERCRLYLKFSC